MIPVPMTKTKSVEDPVCDLKRLVNEFTTKRTEYYQKAKTIASLTYQAQLLEDSLAGIQKELQIRFNLFFEIENEY